MGAKVFEYKSEHGDYSEWGFECPGCGYGHSFRVANIPNPKQKYPKLPFWTFNGNLELPTFGPSLLVNKSDPNTRCHLFVKEGVIQFCNDCCHDKKGQHIPMEDFK